MTRPTVPYAVGRENVSSLADKRIQKQAAALEVNTADLTVERERVDHAWEAWTLKKIPLTRGEAKQKIARQVDEAKSALSIASQLCTEHDLEGIHARVASVALEVETLLSDLADGGSAA